MCVAEFIKDIVKLYIFCIIRAKGALFGSSDDGLPQSVCILVLLGVDMCSSVIM